MANKFSDQDKQTFKEMSDIAAVLNARSQEIADNIGKQGSNMAKVVSASIQEAKNQELSLEKLKSRVALIEEISSGEMSLEQIATKKRDIEDEITAISRRYWGNNKAAGEEKIKQLELDKKLLESEQNRLEASARSEEIMSGIDGLTGGLIGQVKEFGEALKSPIAGTFAVLGLVVGLFMAIAGHTDQIGENFGAIGVNEFQTDLMGATAEAQRLGYGFDEVASSVNELSNNFGVGFDEAIKMSEASMDTARALGISTNQAAQLTGQLMTIGGHSAETAQNFLKQTAALAKSAGVAPAAVMEDMAGASEEIATYTKGSGENMAQAAVKARSMGMALGDVAKIADGLLDFESSLTAEMEASVMIGRQLNLQKARELALAGDLAGLQDEILKQVGSEAEFNQMNALQRKALADSIGVGVDQMSKMVKESGKSTAELAKMRELDISEIVSEDALSSITEMKNMFKSWGTNILAVVAGFAKMGDGLGLIIPLLGVLGVWVGFVALKGAVAGLGMKLMGKGAQAGSTGMASFAAAGTAAIPILLTIAAVAAGIGVAFLGIGYALQFLPPVVTAIANGFVMIAQTIVGGLLQLATPEVVLGIIGLAGAFWLLSGALMSVAFAGLLAMPAMTGVLAFTAAMAALGAVGGGDKDSEMEALKIELQEIKTGINKLVKGFGGDPGTDGEYITDFADKIPKKVGIADGLI